MDRIEWLLQRYYERTETEEEQQELMDILIANPEKVDTAMKKLFDTGIRAGRPDESTAPALKKMLDQVLERVESSPAVPIQRSSRGAWLAAAAVIAVFAIAGVWLFNLNRETAQQSVQERVTFSGKQFLPLPDGSTVLLNDSSELTYQESFDEQVREVTLSGEGYFDIRHDPLRPFIVRAGNVTTKVLGTAFNVKALDDKIIVTVTRGKVEVSDREHVYGQVTPNQQIAVNTLTREIVKKDISADQELTWKSKYLILDDVTMQDAATLIGNYFGVAVSIENDELNGCRISSAFLDGEDLEYVLKVVSSIRQANYKLKGSKATIDGGIGCK